MTVKMRASPAVFFAALLAIVWPWRAAGIGAPALRAYRAGFFFIDIPRGWKIAASGRCETLRFVAYDPARPLRRIFFFDGIGPVYTNEESKALDASSMSMGGPHVPYYDAPVVEPFTPENFLLHFHSIAPAEPGELLDGVPRLEGLTIVSRSAPVSPGGSGAFRARFEESGASAEGLFALSVVRVKPFVAASGGGTGYGVAFLGVTAPSGDFPLLARALVRSAATFRASIDGCGGSNGAPLGAAVRAERSLSGEALALERLDGDR